MWSKKKKRLTKYVIGGGNKKSRSSGQAVPRGFAARFSALELVTAKLRRLLAKPNISSLVAKVR